MIGKCLCGDVQFEIEGEIPNLLQCHCSLCRKQSGSSANASTFVHESKFTWTSGQNNVSHYKKDTGFSSSFCAKCGSPVPNQLGSTDKYWVPAGLLENEEDLEIVVHIYTQSKASWEEIPSSGKHFEEMPDIELLNKALQRTSR
ncbi:GFA family protein [Dasania marina]|uniref:GFA family protein n=1 Tax=Dasania marina TaxID=471499 RepID=UPI00036A6B33|nr:GFA family protein [Dasania marina]